MADTRKKHLKEGLLELHNREKTMTRRIALRSEEKIKERERLINQAERIDERLTNASVPQAMKQKKGLHIVKRWKGFRHRKIKERTKKKRKSDGMRSTLCT